MMKKRKKLLLLWIVVMMVVVYLVTSNGYAAGSFRLEISDAQATEGNLVQVDVSIRGDVAVATLWIAYDRDMLQLVSTSGGIYIETEEGFILDAEQLTQGDLSFSICFMTLQSGQTEVRCTKYDVVDGLGEPLQCSGGEATVSVREVCQGEHQYENGVCTACGDPYGAVLTGRVPCGDGGKEETILTLWRDGDETPLYTLQAGESYSFLGLLPGEYVLQAERIDYVERRYALAVGDSDIVYHVELSPYGDVSQDRIVDLMDLNMEYSHICGTKTLGGYAAECGDMDGDGIISVLDLNRMYSYIAGNKPVF